MLSRNCKILYSIAKACKELHGTARSPHGICKILYSGSTRVVPEWKTNPTRSDRLLDLITPVDKFLKFANLVRNLQSFA